MSASQPLSSNNGIASPRQKTVGARNDVEMSVQFFLDFDGTITTEDVVDKILETFADERWKKIEKEWAAGNLGSRECLLSQMALVKTDETAAKKLLASIHLDPGFQSFLEQAGDLGVPVTVVSDGFDWVIQKILNEKFSKNKELIQSIPVYSNHLVWQDPTPKISFTQAKACEHGCANCKVAVMRSLSKKGFQNIYVGDGLSDRHAAREADFVFAKKKLLEFCQKEKIKHRPYASFLDVEQWLAQERTAYAGR